MPVVSVLIPAYNAEKYLSETIQSVLEQTFTDYEIVIIDDGSRDGTERVVRSFSDPRIRFFRKENGGPASARNVGLKMAQGKWIAFLDSDDLWLPEKLDIQIKVATEHPSAGLIYSDCVRFGEKGLEEVRSTIFRPGSGNVFWKLISEGNFIGTLTVIAKREILLACSGFDESPEIQGSEDYDLWIRVAYLQELFYIPKVLAKYRVRRDGHNRSNLERTYRAYFNVLGKAEKLAGGFDDWQHRIMNKRKAVLRIAFGKSLKAAGDKRKALEQFRSMLFVPGVRGLALWEWFKLSVSGV